MPLIIKGNKDVNIVSKEEIARKVEEEKTKLTPEEAALAKLPAEVAERRREILEAKKHRDYMAKIAKLEEAAKLRIQEEKDVEAEVQVTEEIVVETGPDPIIIKHNDVVSTFPYQCQVLISYSFYTYQLLQGYIFDQRKTTYQ